MTKRTLIVRRRGHVAYWTLNRPRALNSLNADLLAELEAAVAEAATDPEVRVVVLRAAGERAFCAGADLDELRELTAAEARDHLERGRGVLDSIDRLGKPVIAAVNGYALGGGLELALACSVILMSTSASVGLPEVRLGLIPGYGGTQRLPRAIGRQAALQLMLTGEQISAREAYELGLAARPPIDSEELPEAVEALACELSANGPLAMRLVLRAVEAEGDRDFDAALAYETGLAVEALSTNDADEGVRAFREKRAPLFQGN